MYWTPGCSVSQSVTGARRPEPRQRRTGAEAGIKLVETSGRVTQTQKARDGRRITAPRGSVGNAMDTRVTVPAQGHILVISAHQGVEGGRVLPRAGTMYHRARTFFCTPPE